ncbi:MAG: RICIN domain-containing protein [Mycobacterium sp.]|uniref:RICIN domain-containing protein n=1 Tax=Mycobacterium sp. TaxID=1785 RepID=UPI0026387A0F|nr:RICIN domain-containing protein [Mycobacterium sp.]MDI3313641.1 RICIN domain-containing protein [Mycobacterium sp.]
MQGSRLAGFGRRALVVVGAALGVVLPDPGVATAAAPVQLKSRLAGNWCLDAPDGNNTSTMVNPCDGSKSQLWVFSSPGHIESAAFPGQCVSISDAADDTPAMLSPCQTNADHQRWTLQTDGHITSALGPCLCVSSNVANPGTPVIAYHCIAGIPDKEWDIVS